MPHSAPSPLDHPTRTDLGQPHCHRCPNIHAVTTQRTGTSMEPKIWYVTGASRGLGRAVVEAALRSGERVFATARKPEALGELVARYPDTLRTAAVDVTDLSAVNASIAAAHNAFGRIDVVVNNAGYANLCAIEDTDPADFRAQVDTNLFGVVNVTQAVLPTLRAQGAGRIINVSSVGGRVGTVGLGAYQAAKWAVNGFTQVLAQEVRPLGIKVTSIEPGGIQTEWAGASMTIGPISATYQPTVGAFADLLAQVRGTVGGDPALVADAILRLSRLDEPPVRLLLGTDAMIGAHQAAKALKENDIRWAEFSRSTDRPDATPQELDPLGVLTADPAAIVHRFVDEVVNGGNLDVLPDLWADNLRWHGGSLGETHGLAAYTKQLADARDGSFTGMRLTIHDTIVQDDTVVIRFTNSGIHAGSFMGVPATGRHAEWLGIGIYRVRDGKIAEAWFGEDVLGMLLQLGVISLPV
ncbi:SDR family NAD(P)-dependent oxidoreductase [Micromonospora sp. WMMD812]|uniref:SDR family NAD(P)-dependent oxidoreductase n=1 Tax=Micromonospora sp. WMMD812 TaxID=3015152 RepID=UPI00248ADC9E|nr:SDR family NAD(P)-dependent oxidoreductase [Micromonospora sp. WMMD812]WBB69059.1 SDR family NAD(P)-dependent oxidoreductase [Micromonospora sp. WMMD812]